MTQTVPCPNCRQQLRLPENAPGRKVRCPACGTVFAPGAEDEPAPVAAVLIEPPPPRRADDRPRRSGGRRDGRGLAGSPIHLLLLLAAAGLYLAAEGLAFLLRLGAPHNLLVLPALVGLVHWLVAGVGLALCIAVGPSPGVRALAAASLGVSGLHLILALVAILPGSPAPGLPALWNWAALASSLDLLFNLAGGVGLVAGLLELARLVLLACTFRAVALTVRAREVAHHALLLAGAVLGGTLVMALIDTGLRFVIGQAVRAAFESRSIGGFGTVRGLSTLSHVVNGLAVLALLAGNAFVAYEVWDRARRPPRRGWEE